MIIIITVSILIYLNEIWLFIQSGGESTAEDIINCGGFARFYECNVSDAKEVNRMADQVGAEVGEVTMLINNAGILHGLDLMSLSEEQIHKCFEVNTLSQFWVHT